MGNGGGWELQKTRRKLDGIMDTCVNYGDFFTFIYASKFITLCTSSKFSLLCRYTSIKLLIGFPGGPGGKESSCNVGDLGSIPGEGNGNPLQYSCLENPRDRAAWGTTGLGITKSQT